MKHIDEALLNEYLDGLLEPDACRSVEAHLDTCQECCSRLDELRVVFYSLSLLEEKSLAHDLTPGFLDRLPGPALSMGRKLALAIQAGVAMGLLGVIGQVMLNVVRSKVDIRPLARAWIDLAGKVSFSIPDVDIRLPDLPDYSLPFSAPVTIILLMVVLVLWGLGNARLLHNGHEVQR
ncbi:MAG: zf-HC2 domain-containing protein [Anaerolineae bacterium]|nr:zf-HC2 domain-containing protein [Anaerolineae bacterium]